MKNMLTRLFLSVFVICFCGCAGTQSYLRILESDGTIRTDIADNDSYDYKALIENRIDFGWDGGNREDRLKTVNLMFQDSCREVKVLDETAIKKGQYLTGKEAITWVMKIKCIK
jgi:hypothetical protein